ncbi:MAG: outer membrane beta-barrel protein [Chitinophagaceae bacterium]|nr:outer membrane beta-barrel protein [Chitinophagaceae bacterium]
MRKTLLVIVVILLGSTVRAQVKGTVIDSAGKKPIDKAVIGLVVKSNPSDTVYTFTDEKGQFRFDEVPSSGFSIVIRNMGYRPMARYVAVTKKEKTIDIGTMTLASLGKLLEEVVVQVAAIVVKEDTIEYNAGSFKVKENAVVEDLLKKLPGVTVDKDGNVTAQGKSVSRVKVNGKDFFGGDVKTATKELPANIVDKIQVIDDYGDQATVSGIKDGDPDKVINITIKKDKNKGFFGRVTVGGGTDQRYQGSFNGNYFNNNQQISLFANSNNTNSSLFNFGGGGNRGATSMMRSGMSAMSDMGGMSAANGMMQSGSLGLLGSGNNSGVSATNSIGFNYRDQWGKRISVYGSYSYSHRNTSQLTNTSSQNFFENNSFINNQDQDVLTIGNSHRFTFNLEYQVDSFNYLKISPSVNFSGSDANNKTAFEYTQTNGTKTSDGNNKNLTDSKAPNIAATILYNHKFRKRGRNFSASITLGTSENNSIQDVTNLSYQYVTPVGPRNLYQYTDQNNDNRNYGVRFTYSEPLSKIRSLDFSYSHNFSYGRNNKQTFDVDPNTNAKILNNFLTNDYENDYYNNRIGLSLRTTQKKYNYTVGISVLPVNLKGRSITRDSAYKSINRVNVFPIARFVYNFSRTKSFNFNYTGNATQPTFSQLQPVQDLSNPQAITTGNPNLRPSVNHNLNFSYNNFNFISGKVIFTNFTFSTIRNQIVNNTISKGAGRQLSVPENVNGYYNLLGFYAYSKPFKNRKYVITVNGSANYNHNVNLIDSIRNIGQNWVLNQGFTFEFNYKEWLELGAGISYGLNDVKYKNTTAKSVSTLQNSSSNNWTFSHNINIDFTKTLTLKYDIDYTINNGLASSVSRNLVIMNASLEQQLFKKKNGVIRLAAYDLFKQNTNISRNVSANAITDTRTNRLTRYFMLSFTYRLQKFVGQQPQGGGMRTMGAPAMRF